MPDVFLQIYGTVRGKGALQLIIVINQDEPGCQTAGAGAQAGAACSIVEAVGQEQGRKAEHDDDADQLLYDLR